MANAARTDQETPAVTLVPSGSKKQGWRARILARTESVDFTALGYAGVQVKLWVNPPDDLVMQWGEDKAKVTEILADVIREWTLEDDDGQPVAVTPEEIGHLPSDLLAELNHEFWRLRDAPLAQQRERWLSTTSKASGDSSTPPTPSSSTPNA